MVKAFMRPLSNKKQFIWFAFLVVFNIQKQNSCNNIIHEKAGIFWYHEQ